MDQNELLQLHDALVSLNPKIKGVCEENGTIYINDWAPDPTDNERQEAINFIAAWSPLPVPQWKEFRNSIPFNTMAAIEQSLHSLTLYTRLNDLAHQGAVWQGQNDIFLAAWNNAPPALSQQDETDLNNLAQTHNIPLQLSNGVLTAI